MVITRLFKGADRPRPCQLVAGPSTSLLALVLKVAVAWHSIALRWRQVPGPPCREGPVERLIGRKVWVVQFDDDDTSVIGVVEAFDNGFMALRNERETEPSLYVNLSNIKEIEVFRLPGEGELRLLRFPEGSEPSES